MPLEKLQIFRSQEAPRPWARTTYRNSAVPRQSSTMSKFHASQKTAIIQKPRSPIDPGARRPNRSSAGPSQGDKEGNIQPQKQLWGHPTPTQLQQARARRLGRGPCASLARQSEHTKDYTMVTQKRYTSPKPAHTHGPSGKCKVWGEQRVAWWEYMVAQESRVDEMWNCREKGMPFGA